MRLRGSNLTAEKLGKLATINHTIVVCVNAVEHCRRHLLSFSHCRKQVGMQLFRDSRELADSNYMGGCAAAQAAQQRLSTPAKTIDSYENETN